MNLVSRQMLEQRELDTLKPYATFSQFSKRQHPEDESHSRSAFQKDRDRILHTTAFRRLEGKTQVFPNPSDDHYRNRLTHTLEVQQVARSVALSLGLNETLCEAIALAHDLGHPPFGHAGEELLNQLMQHHGGFDHNQQARRIVTQLEDHYPNFLGLNLTLDTLDGLNKHQRRNLPPQSLEAQVVDAADALAYTAHDLDDGLRSGLLTPYNLRELPLWLALLERMQRKHGDDWLDKIELTARQRRLLHREILALLIEDLSNNSAQTLASLALTSSEQPQQVADGTINYSQSVRQYLAGFREFLYQNLYTHWQVAMQIEQAEQVISRIFGRLIAKPTLLPPRPRGRIERDGLRRTVCDHIAGMTDRHAIAVYQRLVP